LLLPRAVVANVPRSPVVLFALPILGLNNWRRQLFGRHLKIYVVVGSILPGRDTPALVAFVFLEKWPLLVLPD